MLELNYNEEQRCLILELGEDTPLPLNVPEINQLFKASDHSGMHLFSDRIADICTADWQPTDEPIIIAEARDASVEIEISDDQMKAFAHFHPAEGGDDLNQQKIIDSLRKGKVYKGIRQRVITALIKEADQAKTHLIATGQDPEQGSTARFKLLTTPIQQRELVPQMREDGTLDMRDLGGIETVDENQPLMERVPPEAGDNGYTVSGEVIFAKPPEVKALTAGEGTHISPDNENLLLASRKGVPVETPSGLKVDDILMVNHDVDISIGNIDYHGSVMVKGDVKEGMRIKATGDIIINGFVEPAILESQCNITIAQGVVGNHKEEVGETPNQEEFSTVLIAQGVITARYAQHAYLCASHVQLGTQLLHCLVKAESRIQVGNEGQRNAKLVGGYLQADKQIAAGVIGAPSFTKTILDFSAPFNKISAQIRELVEKQKEKLKLSIAMQDAKDKLQAMKESPERDEKLSKVLNSESEVTREIHLLDGALDNLKKERIKLKKKVSVRVFDKLYPGVEIRLADEIDTVKEEHRAGTFRFEDDKLVFDR